MEKYAGDALCEPTNMSLAERALKVSQRLAEAHGLLDNMEMLLDGPAPLSGDPGAKGVPERKSTFAETMQSNDDRSRALVNRLQTLAIRLGA